MRSWCHTVPSRTYRRRYRAGRHFYGAQVAARHCDQCSFASNAQPDRVATVQRSYFDLARDGLLDAGRAARTVELELLVAVTEFFFRATP